MAVIGAGPGGCAAALEGARRGLSVALFEPRRGERPKPCGEGMMPAGRAALEHLRLDRVLAQGRPFDGIRYCAPGTRPLFVPFLESGLAVPRLALQAALDEEVRHTPAIALVPAAAVAQRSAPGYRLRAAGREVLARTLAVADGLGGRAADWLRDRRPGRRASRVGVRVHYREREPLEQIEVHLGRGAEVYLTPLPEGVVNVAVLFRRPPADRGAQAWVEHALDDYPAARRVLAAPLGPAEARALGHRRPRRAATGAAFLVGDAGGGVDPIVGCGLTVALRTGIAAGEAAAAVVAGSDERRVARAYTRRLRAETRGRRAVAAGLMRVAARPGLARAAVRAGGLFPVLMRRLAGVVECGGSLALYGSR